MRRRELLRCLGLAGLWSSAGSPPALGRVPIGDSLYAGAGEVVLVHHPGASNASYRVSPEAAGAMVERGIIELTGESSIEAAWSNLLPGCRPGSAVGFKVNTINRLLPTSPALVLAAAGSLTKAGLRPRDVIIWDRYTDSLRRARYPVSLSGDGFRCFGTDEPGIGHDGENRARVLGRELKLSRILTTLTDHLINAPVIKDHATTGFTFALKNHYGTIPLRDGVPWSLPDVMRMHQNGGDPQIAQLNAAPIIRKRTRLVLGDALVGIAAGGPGGAPQWRPNSLILSLDPVAADSVALDLLDSRRRQIGLAPLRPIVRYLATAERLGLGIADPTRIRLRKIELG